MGGVRGGLVPPSWRRVERACMRFWGGGTFSVSVRSGQAEMSTLNVMLAKKEKLEQDLRALEKNLYDLETTYFHDAGQGNVLKGFEGYLALNKHANVKRARTFKTEDRLFSLSSTSSPVHNDATSEPREERKSHRKK